MSDRTSPTDDAAIRHVFVKACRDLRRAHLEEDENKADLFMQVTIALEAAYPKAVDGAN